MNINKNVLIGILVAIILVLAGYVAYTQFDGSLNDSMMKEENIKESNLPTVEKTPSTESTQTSESVETTESPESTNTSTMPIVEINSNLINENLSNMNPQDLQLLNGTIEGSLSYPSEQIPTDMEVCAKNINSGQLYCTNNHLSGSQYTYGKGYQISVPAGEYEVYATTQTVPNYQAYYNEFVTCGLMVGCNSLTPITVTVTAGQTTSDINPWDWYN